MQGVEEQFDTFWEMSGLSETAADGPVSRTQTIRPPTVLLESDRHRSLPRLPKLVGEAQKDTLPELQIRSVLGEGGMGLVRLATQVPLGRDVAVKTLKKGDRTNEEALVVLLREGWVTGILEHPNIVPIYQLGRDEDGDPMIVMKRVEGLAWLDLIRDSDPDRPEFDGEDPLDWHLDVLSQVCNAVHFAHSKGIIHRDLKPENVMIGAFGEVYVLDWGLAVGLKEDVTGRIPSVNDVTGPGGSPGYMAPEMVSPEDRELSERTDVYLLGATLHEIVTGEPPHKGATLRQVMFAAYRSEPKDYPADVPRQLAEICNRAMSREPLDRFATADEFRQALAEYSRRKQSSRLAQQALERLELMRLHVDAEVDDSDDPAIYDAFGQARFGFEQALEVDPENEGASQGLQDALTIMAVRELDRGSYRAASLLIGDLPEQRPDLTRRLEDLREQEAVRHEEFEQLQKIRQAFDIEIGRTTRSIVAVLLGLAWGGMTFLMPELTAATGSEITQASFLTHSVVLVGALIAGLVAGRKRIMKNEANARMVFALVALLLGAMVMRVMLLLGDVPVETGLAFEILLYGVGGSMIAVTLDRRLLFATLPYVASAVLAIMYPALIFRIFGITNLAAMSLLAWVWWPEPVIGSTNQSDG